MISIVKTTAMRRDPKGFIGNCESSYKKQLDAAVREINRKGSSQFVTVGGPSCSGKTTASRRIAAELEKKGKTVHIISVDDFFKTRECGRDEEMAKGGRIDYDSIDALDVEKLAEFSEALEHGREARMPRFDFELGKSFPDGKLIVPDEKSVFLYEGIQTMYPELAPVFGSNPVKIFTSVSQDMEFSEVFFGKRDIRLIRRLVRDRKYRGATLEFTFFIWRSVIMNEEKYIGDYSDSASIKIDSLIPYEVFVIGGELKPLLSEIKETSRYYPKALEFEEKLSKFETWAVDLVPEDSILKEFI